MPRRKKLDAQTVAEVKAKAEEQKVVELGLQRAFAPEGDGEVVHAIGVKRVGNLFTCVEYKIQGDKVLAVEADEPNMRAIAIDCFKIKAQRRFMD